MRKQPYLILLCSLALLAISCSKGDKEQSQQAEDKTTIDIAYYVGDEDTVEKYATAEHADICPVMVMAKDGAVLIGYRYADNNVFLFQDAKEHERWIMSAGEKNIVFTSVEPDSDGRFPIAFLNAEEELNTMFFGYMWEWGEYEYVGEMSLGIEDIPTKAAYNFGDDIRQIIKKDLYDKLSSAGGVDELEFLNWGGIPMGDFIKDVMTVGSIGNLVLADGAGTEFREDVVNTAESQFTDWATGKVQGVILNAIPCPLVRNLAKYGLKKLEKAIAGDSYVEREPDEDEIDSEIIYPVFSRMISIEETDVWEIPEERNPFSLSVSVSDIGENRATFSGKSSYNSDEYGHAYDAPIEQGYMYKRVRDGRETYVQSENMASVSVELETGTKYVVSSYVRTISGKIWYSSNHKRFYTKGARLEFSPVSDFGFGPDGGEQSITVTVSDDAIWRIKSSPSWCKVSATSNTITVSVGQSNKDREGEIVVETTSVYKETKSAKLLVSQKDFNWNNTKWKMTGWYIYGSGSKQKETTEAEFKNINKGYSEPDGSSGEVKYYVNGKGQAIMEVKSYSNSAPCWDEVYTFTRTGPTTATCVLDGTHLQAGWSAPVTIKVTGEYDCVLIQ
ncbi:MAG: BACON domain-containing protein [Bacteroidales bacterium]|nr:BACON domain-containing protein [Bacteroidales bacterium]